MVKFVKLEGIPLVSEFNEETAPKIFGGDITQHLLMFAAKSDESFATEMGMCLNKMNKVLHLFRAII